jgi:hypothetical protein
MRLTRALPSSMSPAATTHIAALPGLGSDATLPTSLVDKDRMASGGVLRYRDDSREARLFSYVLRVHAREGGSWPWLLELLWCSSQICRAPGTPAPARTRQAGESQPTWVAMGTALAPPEKEIGTGGPIAATPQGRRADGRFPGPARPGGVWLSEGRHAEPRRGSLQHRLAEHRRRPARTSLSPLACRRGRSCLWPCCRP